MKKITLTLLGLLLLGCGGSPGGQVGMCDGFFSPSANIYVRDAITKEIISNATVLVNSIGENERTSAKATFIDGDDNLSNSETYAYYASIGINESTWLINFTVASPRYETFESENYGFILQTTCEAKNNFVSEVFLCPYGEVCN